MRAKAQAAVYSFLNRLSGKLAHIYTNSVLSDVQSFVEDGPLWLEISTAQIGTDTAIWPS